MTDELTEAHSLIDALKVTRDELRRERDALAEKAAFYLQRGEEWAVRAVDLEQNLGVVRMARDNWRKIAEDYRQAITWRVPLAFLAGIALASLVAGVW